MRRSIGLIALLVAASAAVYAGVAAWMPAAIHGAGLAAGAAVPGIVQHQGVVSVNGTRFSGPGSFKFAIVDVTTGLNLWTNDGTQIGATNPPTDAVAVTVADGIYNVALGDTSLANMNVITAAIFANANTALRVWFTDGVNGFQQLSPDHKLRTVPYAFRAETVTAGSIGTAELADDTVSAAKIADGAVTSAKIANGAVGSAKLAAGAVSTGQLADGSVTTAKIADGAVASGKLASDIGVWSKSGSDVSYPSGNVGIGGLPSGFKLDVAGSLRLKGNSTLTFNYVQDQIRFVPGGDEWWWMVKPADGKCMAIYSPPGDGGVFSGFVFSVGVLGDVSAQSFNPTSTRTLKKDIHPLADDGYADILDKLAHTNVYTFRFKNEPDDVPPRIGLIAEETPREMAAESGLALDLSRSTACLLAGLKAQQKEIQELKQQVKDLNERLSQKPLAQ